MLIYTPFFFQQEMEVDGFDGPPQGSYRRKDDNRKLRVKMAICAIASEFTIA